MQYLRTAAPYAECFHIPNGGYRRKLEASILKGMGVKSGVADICILWRPARVAFIELKAPQNRDGLSPAQVQFRMRLLELEIPFSVCKSIDDVRASLQAWGVPHRG